VFRRDIAFNYLSGTLSSALGSLSKLATLSLGNNKWPGGSAGLSGSIPASLASLSELALLSLTTNSFSGTIPQALVNLTNLKVLDVSANSLSGPLPPGVWSLLSTVTFMSLFSNNLSGSLPEFPQLPLASSVSGQTSYFDVGGNMFSGMIPESIGNLSALGLDMLNLYSNNFSGGIPSSIGSLVTLTLLDFSQNALSGSLPSSFSSLNLLVSISLQHNALSGTLPCEVTSLPNLMKLYLYSNTLQGSLVDCWAHLPSSLTSLNVFDNRLSGTIPDWLGSLSLSELNLGSNDFEGSLPPSLGFTTYLSLFDNRLTGTIPPELAAPDGRVGNAKLKSLDLGNNNLSGTIPFSIGESMFMLQALVLTNNEFSGLLPANLGTVGPLAVCLLSGGTNNFSCPLPTLPLSCAATLCICPAGQYFLNGDCAACAPGSISAAGSTSCTTCARNTYSVDGVACTQCPVTRGIQSISPAASSSLSACTCPPGLMRRDANSSWFDCLPCPSNALIVANSNTTLCACAPGFYDSLFGASLLAPACAACPLGGVCTTGFVGAAEGYWRNSTLSDVFYRCREGRCRKEEMLGGPLSSSANVSSEVERTAMNNSSSNSTNCVEGAGGPLCALCLPGYAMQSGACSHCSPSSAWYAWSDGDKAALLACCVVFALALTTFGFFLPVLPFLERRVNHASSFLSEYASRLLPAGRKVAEVPAPAALAPAQAEALDKERAVCAYEFIASEDSVEAGHANAVHLRDDDCTAAVPMHAATPLHALRSNSQHHYHSRRRLGAGATARFSHRLLFGTTLMVGVSMEGDNDGSSVVHDRLEYLYRIWDVSEEMLEPAAKIITK